MNSDESYPARGGTDFEDKVKIDDLIRNVDYLINENRKIKNVVRALLRKNKIEIEGF